jgi:cellulose synthase/poly-beta-1,6-N-acetylglucosamine synthase-like glycosyltransferase
VKDEILMSALTFAPLLFWSGAAVVVYAYVLYPLLIWALARTWGRVTTPAELSDAELPSMSLLIAALNEEAVIEDRIRNALALDYPRGKLEIVIGSDGSTDRTAEIVRRYASRGVRLIDFPMRRGKASVLNDSVPGLSGELVLFSDANTEFDPRAARRLARWFRDPAVGAAVGRLILVDSETGRNVDGLYWRYETFLKTQEARLGGLLGANGAIYALRKDRYVPIPAGTIIDDFVVPLLAKVRSGCTLAYDGSATAVEETAPDIACEFRRRTRIGAGGFQSIGLLRGLLDPRQGWTAFTFLSHKLLRWFCPFCLLLMLIASIVMTDRHDPAGGFLLNAQVLFYLVAVSAEHLPDRLGRSKPVRLTSMFAEMNLALLVGFARWLAGAQKATWRRTVRTAELEVVR